MTPTNEDFIEEYLNFIRRRKQQHQQSNEEEKTDEAFAEMLSAYHSAGGKEDGWKAVDRVKRKYGIKLPEEE